ncbi:MAG: hypothetical protein LPK25_05870 [Cyclobacteriaceae bacterium]|nr:hypothetical protein [Cyclobacteriaceae bacterium]
MKNILGIGLLWLFSVSFAHAQYKNQWTVSQGYEVRTNPAYFGMNASVEYFPAHYFSIRPSYVVYLPSSGKATGLNLDIRYFLTEKKNQWYATAGYGYYQRKYEGETQPMLRQNYFHLGTGINLKLMDQLGLNPEIQSQLGPDTSWVFKIGLVYFVN